MDERLHQIDALLKTDPEAAEHLAERVLRETAGIAVDVARALCRWGGVQRVRGRWDAAERAYREAEPLLRRANAGPGDWLDWHGRLLFLRRDQRRLVEALDHARRMLDLALEMQDVVRLARVLVDEALVVRLVDRDVAGRLAREALAALPEDDRAYRRSALHVVLSCLCYDDAPDLDEIDRRLDEVRAFNDPPDSSPGVKLKWFEGLAELRHSRPATAVPLLQTAYDGLVALNAPGYAATCALDLAEAHLANANPASAAGVAGLIFPLFGSLRHIPGATAALRLFCRAAESGRLSVKVVREAREGLRGSGG